MADEDLLAIIVLLSNFLSAYYTAFCIEASTKRYHWFYKGLHRNDLNWYATWYSCQTYAILVSTTNAIIIYVLGLRLREWLLNRGTEPVQLSSDYKPDFEDRISLKKGYHEAGQFQDLTTLWSSSAYTSQPHHQSKQHILPMYNSCPFTTSSAKRLLWLRSKQLKAWGRGIRITPHKILYWMASTTVLGGVAAVVWNVGLVPYWITLVDLRREDRVVMIPWNYN